MTDQPQPHLPDALKPGNPVFANNSDAPLGFIASREEVEHPPPGKRIYYVDMDHPQTGQRVKDLPVIVEQGRAERVFEQLSDPNADIPIRIGMDLSDYQRMKGKQAIDAAIDAASPRAERFLDVPRTPVREAAQRARDVIRDIQPSFAAADNAAKLPPGQASKVLHEAMGGLDRMQQANDDLKRALAAAKVGLPTPGMPIFGPTGTEPIGRIARDENEIADKTPGGMMWYSVRFDNPRGGDSVPVPLLLHKPAARELAVEALRGLRHEVTVRVAPDAQAEGWPVTLPTITLVDNADPLGPELSAAFGPSEFDPFAGEGYIQTGPDGERQRVLPPAGRCDFCTNKSPVWEYPATTFTVPSPTGEPYTSEGNWAACATCADLIERNDYAGLARRNAAGKPKRVRQAALYWAQNLYEHFRQHRTGERSRTTRRAMSMSEDEQLAEATTKLDPQFARMFEQRKGPAREPTSAEAMCDFDAIQPVLWRYPAMSFDYVPDGADRAAAPAFANVAPWHSEGDWGACDGCSRLIERADWDKLALRNMRSRMLQGRDLHDAAEQLPPALRSRLAEWSNRQSAKMFQEFSRHRTGPRKPVFPTANARLPEASPLAQIAFGEQLKLLRWATSEDARVYVGDWLQTEHNRGPQREQQQRSFPRATDQQMLQLIVPLRYGETFFWARETSNMIRESSTLLNTETPWTLNRDALPAASGFFYCDAKVGDSAGFPLRAIAWTLAFRNGDLPVWNGSTAQVGLNNHGRGSPADAIGISLVWFSETPPDARSRGLRPSGFTFWEFGRDHVWSSHPHGGDPDSTYTSIDEDRLATLATMFAFVQQRILVASRPYTPDRATRKQQERERPEHEPILRVIELRKRKYVGGEPLHRCDECGVPEASHGLANHMFVTKVVDWQNQWYVRRHPRFQCFDTRHHAEGTCVHQTIFIEPFIKGPPDKPLKAPKPEVFAVIR